MALLLHGLYQFLDINPSRPQFDVFEYLHILLRQKTPLPTQYYAILTYFCFRLVSVSSHLTLRLSASRYTFLNNKAWLGIVP